MFRFMWWTNTWNATLPNNSDPSEPLIQIDGNWSDRTTPSDAFWGTENGVPVETEVSLLNQMNADGWFSLPVTSSDDYMNQYATLVHNSLSSNQKAYVEFANEVWNFANSGINYAEEQGEALWPSALTTIDPLTNRDYSAYDIGLNWYAMRAAQMCDAWKSAWGADANRVVCVMGSQAAYAPVSQEELACNLWSEAPCATNHGISALAIAPYFGYSVPDSWTTDPDGGLDKIFQEINSGGVSPPASGAYPSGMIAQSISWIPPQKAIANSYGLQLDDYESGQTLVDNGDTALTNLDIAANEDPRMGSSTFAYMQDMQNAGVNIINYFDDAGAYGQFGSFGSMTSIYATSSPKYNALVDLVDITPPTLDTTPPSVPSNVAATATGDSSINVTWNASTDNVAVEGYRIFRNGTQIASVSSTTLSYGDTGLTSSTSYSYTVNAYDAMGNQSAQSSSASATTGSPGLNPTFVTAGEFTASSTQLIATSTPLGTPSSTRFVMVIINVRAGSCQAGVSSATIDGVSATIDGATTDDFDCIDFISATVPADTVGDIVVNMVGSGFQAQAYAVYTIDGSQLASTTANVGFGTTSTTSETASVSATAGGFILGSYINGNTCCNVPTISGGSTQDDTSVGEFGNGSMYGTAWMGFYHLGSAGTSGSTPATKNRSGNVSGITALAAWH